MWRERYPEKNRAIARVYRKPHDQHLKKLVIEAYGGKCFCCGESQLKFLTLDHINGGGKEHRRGSKGAAFYARLKSEGFPGGIRVACWNCNCGRQLNGGICPHLEASV